MTASDSWRVPVTVSLPSPPWSATAFSVASGMVLTTPATTSSSTYSVSG